jgi:hypothetical protein
LLRHRDAAAACRFEHARAIVSLPATIAVGRSASPSSAIVLE